MDKKGQIYIIAAILLSVVIFAIASVTNVAKQEKFKGDFDKLSNNYEAEGAKLVNTIANTQGDVGEKFGRFTYDFTAYSKTQNPQFGVIYVLDYDKKVYLGNYLVDDIYIDYGGENLMKLSGCFAKVGASVTFGALSASFDTASLDLGKCVDNITEPTSQNVYVLIGKLWYPFKLVSGKPQLMVVSQMEQEQQRKVFVGGEGFTKEVKDYCDLLNSQTHGQNICKEVEQAQGPCSWDSNENKCKFKTESASELQKEINQG